MSRALFVGRSLGRVTHFLNQALHVDQINQKLHNIPAWTMNLNRCMSGEGEGKGGGSGGSIKSAGGAFGKKEAAHEEQFFREKQAQQIKELKTAMADTLKSKLQHHQGLLAIHNGAIKRHKELLEKDGNTKLHEFHILQHEEAAKYEQSEIQKIMNSQAKLHLDI